MPDFAWGRQQELLWSRAQAATIFQQLGYEIPDANAPAKLERTQRPRLIAWSPAHQARLELIGPDEAIFKATLSVPTNENQTEPLRQFLTVWLPTWTEGTAWLAENLTPTGPQIPAETKFRELTITLRAGHHGTQTLLGVTWQG
jgi:hypothetical protein